MNITIPANDPIAVIATCDICRGLMRLVGTEPHATRNGVDLHTYTCTVCDALRVVAVSISTKAHVAELQTASPGVGPGDGRFPTILTR